MAADGPIEQLHYTWAPRGVEGINRFQIAAISPGLKKSAMARLMPAIRKICRYDRPKPEAATLPVSFGWFDHRGYRIAFSRVGLPRSAGKRAGFAAHVLVGPPAVLGEASIASTFGSSFWWTGLSERDHEEIAAGKRDFELPALGLEDVLADRIEDGDAPRPAVLALGYGLLTLPAEGRLAVRDERGDFGPALRQLALRLPEALAGVSLSTYEGGSATFPFRVLGTARPGPRSRGCDLAEPGEVDGEDRRLLERLLGSSPEDELLREAARHAAGAGAGAEALWAVAGELADLADRERAADAGIARTLTDPDVVVYVSRGKAGPANVARALYGGALPVRDALARAWTRIGSAVRDALAEAIVGTRVEAKDFAGIAAAVAALPEAQAREAALDRALAAVGEEEGLARTLLAEDAEALIARAAERGAAASGMSELLTGAARHVDRCAARRDVPRDYLTAMFKAGLGDARNDHALAEALRVRPDLLVGSKLDDEQRDACLELLERLPAQRLESVLPGLLPTLADGERIARVRTLLSRLSAESGGRCIVAAGALGLDGGGASLTIDELCDDWAALLVRRGMVALAVEVLDCGGSPNESRAAHLLRREVRHPAEPALPLVREATAVRHDSLRSALLERALDRAAAGVRRPEDVNQIWPVLSEVFDRATDAQLLERLLEHASRSLGGACGPPVLAWVATELLPARPKLLGRGARLRERESEERARTLAAAAPEHEMEAMRPWVDRTDRRCLAWWKELERQSRKHSRRRRRLRG